MKPEPIIAMVLLLFLGVWLVVQPTLGRARYDLDVRVGSMEVLMSRVDDRVSGGALYYRVVSPPKYAGQTLGPQELDGFLAARIAEWDRQPGFARLLLGFFNVSAWSSFVWVAVGLIGQAAFFGRMIVQWVVSERSRVSKVPELFWWLSFLGGVTLFVYFVWRKDAIGVLGQSTGIVVYARNLRLIHKQRRHIAGPIEERIA